MVSAWANAPAVLATSKGLMRMAPLRRLEHAENSEASTTPAETGSPLAKMYSSGIRFKPWLAVAQSRRRWGKRKAVVAGHQAGKDERAAAYYMTDRDATLACSTRRYSLRMGRAPGSVVARGSKHELRENTPHQGLWLQQEKKGKEVSFFVSEKNKKINKVCSADKCILRSNGNYHHRTATPQRQREQ